MIDYSTARHLLRTATTLHRCNQIIYNEDIPKAAKDWYIVRRVNTRANVTIFCNTRGWICIHTYDKLDPPFQVHINRTWIPIPGQPITPSIKARLMRYPLA